MSGGGGHGRRRGHEEEHEEHENHERWLVSYADMMTLLMVLFIVMFAISQVDQRKFMALKTGLAAGFGAPVAFVNGAEKLLDPGGSVAPDTVNLAGSAGDGRSSAAEATRQKEQAQAEYRRALDLQGQLATDFPRVRDYQVGLGAGYCNLGHLVREGGRPADSLVWFDQAIRALGPLVAREPRLVTPRQFLRNSHVGRALALMKLGRFAEAGKDWGRASELDEGPGRVSFRLRRAMCLTPTDPARAPRRCGLR